MQRVVRRTQQVQAPTTLLSRDWKIIFVGALALYAILITATRYQQQQFGYCHGENKAPQCDSWLPTFQSFVVGSSAAAIAFQFCHICLEYLSNKSRNSISAYMTAFVIMIISFVSELVNYYGILEQPCPDAFGVWSTRVQWSEWQITVPIMFYLCITLDCEKKKLSTEDVLIIFGSWLAIFFVYTLNWGFSLEICQVLIASAMVIMTTCVSITTYRSMQAYSTQKVLAPSTAEGIIVGSVATKRLSCTLFLLFSLPMFPMVYFGRVFGYIDHTVGVAAVAFLNFATKAIYALILMHGHLECLDPTHYQYLAEKSANEARRAFLRYVFHEVRSPLNSMTMGLHILLDSKVLEGRKEEVEALLLMREASQYISEALNEVLNMQKVDEGMLVLQFDEFKVREMIPDIVEIHKELISAKGVKIKTFVSKQVPESVDGDCKRLQQALSNLVSNAVKFSATGSTIELRVSLDENEVSHDKNTSCIKFSVLDEGPGIARDDEKNLFVPYVQLRPGELKAGRGAGVGLAMCKEIVSMHNGFVGYAARNLTYHNNNNSNNSNNSSNSNNVGSEFYCVIPFKVKSHAKRSASDEEVLYSIPSRILKHAPIMAAETSQLQQGGVVPGVMPSVPPTQSTTSSTSSTAASTNPTSSTSTNPTSSTSTNPTSSTTSTNPTSSTSTNPTSSTSTNPTTTTSTNPTTTTTSTNPTNPNSPNPATTSSTPTGPSDGNSSGNSGSSGSSGSSQQQEASIGSRLNVLIVDDVLSNRKMLSMLLTKRGIKCEMAVDGVEAVNVVLDKKRYFDLLFMDNMMPNMNGVECTRRLRAGGFDRLILGLTGNTMDNEILEFENAGADMVLPKPLKLGQLDALLSYFDRHGSMTTIHSRSEADANGVRKKGLEASLHEFLSADNKKQ